MTNPFRLVADWVRATIVPPLETTEEWNAKAARTVAKHKRDHPRIVIVKVTKRRTM